MVKAAAALIAGGFALMIGVQSALVVAAAPLNSSAPAAVALSGKAPSGSSPTSLGHFYGKAVSNLAHITPGGPEHGRLISAFATSSNPSHTKGHRGRGLALGRAKH